MLDLWKYKLVRSQDVFNDLAQQRVVFWADTNHFSPVVQFGLIRGLDGALTRSPCQDVGVEVSPEEVSEMWGNAKQHSTNHFDAPFLDRVGQQLKDTAHLSAHPLFYKAFSAVVDCAYFKLADVHQFTLHGVDVDKSRRDSLHQLFTKAEQQQNLILAHYATKMRKDMDPEIAAHIWYAARKRPVSVVLGALHLRDDGVPKHFEGEKTVTVAIFADLAALRERAAQEEKSIVSPLNARTRYIHLTREDAWLKVGNWFGSPLRHVYRDCLKGLNV